MRSYSHFASLGRRKRPNRHFAGREAVDSSHCLGALSGKTSTSRELQRNALPSGRYSPLHVAYQLRMRREAFLERETDLRMLVRDRLAEGWTPEQISGWLKSGNEPRLRARGY
jgi:IS30 family transposase